MVDWMLQENTILLTFSRQYASRKTRFTEKSVKLSSPQQKNKKHYALSSFVFMFLYNQINCIKNEGKDSTGIS